MRGVGLADVSGAGCGSLVRRWTRETAEVEAVCGCRSEVRAARRSWSQLEAVLALRADGLDERGEKSHGCLIALNQNHPITELSRDQPDPFGIISAQLVWGHGVSLCAPHRGSEVPSLGTSLTAGRLQIPQISIGRAADQPATCAGGDGLRNRSRSAERDSADSARRGREGAVRGRRKADLARRQPGDVRQPRNVSRLRVPGCSRHGAAFP